MQAQLPLCRQRPGGRGRAAFRCVAVAIAAAVRTGRPPAAICRSARNGGSGPHCEAKGLLRRERFRRCDDLDFEPRAVLSCARLADCPSRCAPAPDGVRFLFDAMAERRTQRFCTGILDQTSWRFSPDHRTRNIHLIPRHALIMPRSATLRLRDGVRPELSHDRRIDYSRAPTPRRGSLGLVV